MALYRIEWKYSARKELKRLARFVIPKILKLVEGLTEKTSPPVNRKIIVLKIPLG